jgi:hypothetical protein
MLFFGVFFLLLFIYAITSVSLIFNSQITVTLKTVLNCHLEDLLAILVGLAGNQTQALKW